MNYTAVFFDELPGLKDMNTKRTHNKITKKKSNQVSKPSKLNHQNGVKKIDIPVQSTPTTTNCFPVKKIYISKLF